MLETGLDQEFSLPLPRSLDTRIHMRLIARARVLTLHLTTASAGDGTPVAQMGCMVFALPDRFNKDQPLSTVVVPDERSVDFTTRLAKLLVKKTQMPTYVTNSVSLADMGLGGTMEEEMEAFKAVVGAVLPRLKGMADLTLQDAATTSAATV